MQTRIVVGVDDSDNCLIAVASAAAEAALRGRPLHILHADPFGQPLTTPADEQPSDSGSWILDRAVDWARAAEPVVEVDGEVVRRFPQQALIDASQTAELVVIGDRGLSALQRAVVDTVAGGLAMQSSCPVLVTRGAGDPDGPIIVGIDGSAAGEAAVGFAFAEADLRGCDLVAVHAWSRPVAYDASHTLPLVFDEDAIQAGAERLVSEALTGWHEKHPDVRVRHRLVHGRARRVLTEAANGGQMLVVGTRGRSVLPDVELGSVSSHLLHDAPSPIVVVPQAWTPGHA
ncbi:MAG: universal stress protein [Catenulisporales bacterium]|nr:universal stress protein [Catenulisporales bacterium]